MPQFFPQAVTPQSIIGMTGNTSFIVPAGFAITGLIVENTTANAVTGGLRFGTTGGGADVVVALAVAASAIAVAADAAMLKRFFSRSANQAIFVEAVVAWNAANVNMSVLMTKAF